jgi:hypothetical protein
VPPAATAGATGYYALQVMSLGTLQYNSLQAPHPTHLEIRIKEPDMIASKRVLKPMMHKEADEREFLTRCTAGQT